MKRVLVAVFAAVTLITGLSACNSGSLSPVSSPAPSSHLSSLAPSGSSPISSPSPADSNPAAMLSDGSRVELADMGGGPGEMDILLKVTAGSGTTLSLGNSDTLDIHPVDNNTNDQWTGSAPQFSYWSESPPTNQPDVLEPGQSVCVDETFNSSNPQASVTDVTAVNVTIRLGNGSTEQATLPSGGGSGSVCGITISGLQ
jgi:hypothetical protein